MDRKGVLSFRSFFDSFFQSYVRNYRGENRILNYGK